MANPDKSNRSRTRLDCGSKLKWLFLWDLSCSDIAGCSRGLRVFGSWSCLLENNSWKQRGGWTTGRKKVLNILLENLAEEDNATQQSTSIQLAFPENSISEQIKETSFSLCVTREKREWSTTWTGWKGDGGEHSQTFMAVLRKGEENPHFWSIVSGMKTPWSFLLEKKIWARNKAKKKCWIYRYMFEIHKLFTAPGQKAASKSSLTDIDSCTTQPGAMQVSEPSVTPQVNHTPS